MTITYKMNIVCKYFTSTNKQLSIQLLTVIGLLLISRLGHFIPIPGLDFYSFIETSGGWDSFQRHGGVYRISLFYLGIWPYISVSLCAQLALWVFPGVARLSDTATGRKRLNYYIRILTIVMAAVQAQGVAAALENAYRPIPFVLIPSWLFQISTVATLTAGVMILVWLSDEISRRGFGDGALLLLFVQYLQVGPSSIQLTMDVNRMGILPPERIVFLVLGLVGLLWAIVFMESARRHILVERIKNDAQGGADNPDLRRAESILALKLNPSGLVAPLLSGTLIGLLMMPVTIFLELGLADQSHWFVQEVNAQPAQMVLLAIADALTAFALGATAIRSRAVASWLAKIGVWLPEVELGESPEAHINYVQRQTAFLGAAYLTALMLLPKTLFLYFATPYAFGGSTLLVMVLVCLNIMRAFQQNAE
jgi:preprotein translocase subunit SecY